jgi:hypothetical protein
LTNWILQYCRGGCTLSNDEDANEKTGVMHCDIGIGIVSMMCLAERKVACQLSGYGSMDDVSTLILTFTLTFTLTSYVFACAEFYSVLWCVVLCCVVSNLELHIAYYCVMCYVVCCVVASCAVFYVLLSCVMIVTCCVLWSRV